MTKKNEPSYGAAILSLLIPGLGQAVKGSMLMGLIWFLMVVIGYCALIVPGLILHFLCVVRAAR